jgi:hypothetical protein
MLALLLSTAHTLSIAAEVLEVPIRTGAAEANAREMKLALTT